MQQFHRVYKDLKGGAFSEHSDMAREHLNSSAEQSETSEELSHPFSRDDVHSLLICSILQFLLPDRKYPTEIKIFV